jgi:hypothetical protein
MERLGAGREVMRKMHKPGVGKNQEPEFPLLDKLQDLELLIVPKTLGCE